MASKKNAVISAQDVYKIYKMGEVEVRAVNGISIDIKQGDYISIMGPSGSGKTTLLDLLSALLRPSAGEIYVAEKPISKMNDNQLARIRGKTIGFIFQTFNLIPRMTAMENVSLPLWFEGISKTERETTARNVLEKVGLGHRLNHNPTELSGGERQRVAIARALANNPDVVVADEPTGNLDSKSGSQVMEIIDSLHKDEGKTILMVTHDPEIDEHAKKQVRIKDGRIVSG